MKDPNQGKVNTRRGLTGLLCIALAALLTFSSCNINSLEDVIYPNRHYFGWTLEFEVNGEKVEAESIFETDRGRSLFMTHRPEYQNWPRFLRFYSGSHYDSESRSLLFDYSKLAFNIMHSGLYLHILGPGQGKFKKNIAYSSPDDIVLYHPALLSDFASQTLNPHNGGDWDIIPTFNGYEVKLLSSSFKFSHSLKWGVGKVLDFYFEFEEVITAVPEGWTGSPTVGDTLRITTGHLIHLYHEMDEAAFE